MTLIVHALVVTIPRPIYIGLIAVLVALSAATGAVKLFFFEPDLRVFAAIGFNAWTTFAFGLAQLVGAVLVVPVRTRRIGGVTMAVTFAVATVALFASGQTTFGVFSILFIALACVALVRPKASIPGKVVA